MTMRRPVYEKQRYPACACQQAIRLFGFAMLLVFLPICYCFGQGDVESVRFRMLEYPFSPNFDISGQARLPEINPDHFSSPSLTVQLSAIQSTVAHCVAGDPVPEAIAAEIVRILSLETPAAIRRAAVSAAVQLDLKDAAGRLLEIAQEDSTLAMQIEPALAAWKFAPAHDYWIKRLESDEKVDTQLNALQGIAALKNANDEPIVERMLLSSSHAPVRLAAANLLGGLRRSGLEDLARQRLALAKDSSQSMAALETAYLLQVHSSPEAMALLLDLRQSSNHAAAHAAYRALANMNFGEKTDVAIDGLNHADSNIRRTCLEFVASLKSPEYVANIADSMADPIPENRFYAANLLASLAKTESLRSAVVDQATRMLSSSAWQGREQAIRLAVALEFKESIPRLFELAEDNSRDVYVTAAWGLRKLVQTPDDLKRTLDLATQLTEKTKLVNNPVPITVDDYHRIAHLLELLGEQKYLAATELMERFIPKNSGYHTVARAAAIWGLGSIFENDPAAACRTAIQDRMMDFRSQAPENVFVRYAATVAIGRIADDSAIPFMQQIPEPSITPIGQARDWAIDHIRKKATSP